MLLLNFLILVIVCCLVAWLATHVARQAGAPPMVHTIIWVVVALVVLVWLIGGLSGGPVLVVR
jgi:hypothetical protein